MHSIFFYMWLMKRYSISARHFRQNRQTVNKNSNEMAKGPFGKWRFWRKWRIWEKWRLIAQLAKL